MKSVIKGTGYILVHAPDMVLHNGSTQRLERVINGESEYLKKLPNHLRTFDEAVAYYPNQVYIGNKTPEELAAAPQPWHDKLCPDARRDGKFGQIMPQEEFLLLMRACDVFDLVHISREFVAKTKDALAANELLGESILARVGEGEDAEEIARRVDEGRSEGLYHGGVLVGCVDRAHEIDDTLTAHVMHENIVYKASCVLALLSAVKNAGIAREEVDYVIDCSEEACGDMNQRGGGNFAKSVAEIAGLARATGSDCRGFCAAPAHAIIEAAALVASGAYKTVIVTSGGSTAKLGMNAKDHVKNDLPILEDMLAGFAAVITADDGASPVIDLSLLGRHTVGTGSAPQAVISSLVTDPLDRAGLKISDIDKFSPEMQNPDITKPAGAGDVPLSNYKMIAALAVRRGEIEKNELPAFIEKHGLVGWAPTQGHIPSGVPYLGFACERIREGSLRRVMVIGKGSLFLGRMTNLFDGVSFVVTANDGKANAAHTGARSEKKRPRIALTGMGGEHGEKNAVLAAQMAASHGVEVVYIGSYDAEGIAVERVSSEEQAHERMEQLLRSGSVDGVVTMHYPFPIGVSTVGRVVTPARGREMFIASTTGTASADRVESLVKNAISGIAAAKACGIAAPTVGILNVEGAPQAESILRALGEGGYDIRWAESARSDGGALLRGNDVLQGTADVLVTDSLTGNVLVKMLGAYTTGGSFESVGFGYGPGIGKGYDKLVLIVSRASGAPVVANALTFAAQLADGDVRSVARREFEAAERAGLSRLLAARGGAKESVPHEDTEISPPPAEPCTESISGVDVLDIEDAAKALWKEGIYAETGMGCTGPLVMMSRENRARAEEILKKAGYIG